MYGLLSAPMAKLDKASAYEAGDCRFESCSERHFAFATLPSRVANAPSVERWPSG